MADLHLISGDIIKAAIEVRKEPGSGLPDSGYRKCLANVLRDMGCEVQEEIDLPLKFRGRVIEGNACRIDLMTNRCVVVEVNSVEELKPPVPKQTGTYLKLMELQLGC